MSRLPAYVAAAIAVILLGCVGGITALGGAVAIAACAPTSPGPSDAGATPITESGPASPGAVMSPCTPPAGIPSDFSLPPATPQSVVTAITWAFAQLGTPYHLDGDCTAAHSGNPAHECDCSSLVQQAYRAAGLTLPRTADEQSRVGQPIDPAAIQSGDLIFIPGSDGTRKHPGHVGMYIGDQYVVEAPHTGANVRIVHYGGDWITQQIVIRRPT
jgi:cell wall-associated NlpC family hydrolase